MTLKDLQWLLSKVLLDKVAIDIYRPTPLLNGETYLSETRIVCGFKVVNSATYILVKEGDVDHLYPTELILKEYYLSSAEAEKAYCERKIKDLSIKLADYKKLLETYK